MESTIVGPLNRDGVFKIMLYKFIQETKFLCQKFIQNKDQNFGYYNQLEIFKTHFFVKKEVIMKH